ncbi:hypothetical protein [Streptomyces sp. MB09-02B]|uniref:hypothetical protein n=1 Tax=Streptomyces sp. MB09-02B TaxID=3028667 RepID=UPI0029A07D8B|nr:hypothetical protein [Streptomyces sp. MB09-02B]MDX3641714.1 hypothetical protein [Streptomyces sp. MB09-02B]
MTGIEHGPVHLLKVLGGELVDAVLPDAGNDVVAGLGNAWEWLATPTTPGRYELRGSAFTSPLFRGVPAIVNDASDMMHDDDTGFRCVATPEQMATRKR